MVTKRSSRNEILPNVVHIENAGELNLFFRGHFEDDVARPHDIGGGQVSHEQLLPSRAHIERAKRVLVGANVASSTSV